MAVRRFVVGLAALSLIAAACGDDAADQTVVAPAPAETSVTSAASPDPDPFTSTTTTTTSVPIATTSAPPAAGPPGIAALTSGRGDDGSLEIGIWFSSNPFEAGDARLLIGTDSDESYPGTGDPVPHIDGWATMAGDAVALLDDGTVIADDETINEWLSWTGPGELVWTYFIQNVPVRAGTVWVVLELDGIVIAAAGAPFGDGCSFHSAGLALGAVGDEIPDFGVACWYPLG